MEERICPECEEPMVEGANHPDCCPHEHVEEHDDRDGAFGTRWFLCIDCDSPVQCESEEDGWTLVR